MKMGWFVVWPLLPLSCPANNTRSIAVLPRIYVNLLAVTRECRGTLQYEEYFLLFDAFFFFTNTVLIFFTKLCLFSHLKEVSSIVLHFNLCDCFHLL